MDLRSDKRQKTSKEGDSLWAGAGEAQDRQQRELESLTTFNEDESPAGYLTLSNRRVRTRTHGGVAGVGG